MVLCFGAFASILIKCSLPGTTNRTMVSTLIGTIDPDNTYGDGTNDTSVSRLINCERDFPTIKVTESNGPIRSVGGSQTNIVTMAKEIRPSEVEECFDPVIELLDEDKKPALVGALFHLIKNDDSLSGSHRALFSKCMGNTAARVIESTTIDLKSFLARIFLYTVLTNENKSGKESLSEINDISFIDRFHTYPVLLQSASFTDYDDSFPCGRIPDGRQEYMRKLYKKLNCLPTILHKEAFTPFRDYYVPNNVSWREKVPGERYTYRLHVEKNVSLEKLIGISRFLVLSGTGGLGKSMMMRNLILTSIDEYDKLELIPLFIPLKDYSSTYKDLLSYILEIICSSWPVLKRDDLITLLLTGNVLLLFDGLDEISSTDLLVFTKQLNALMDRFTDNTFVISSRPYSNFQSFTRFTVLQLEPLTKDQAIELVDRFNYRADAPKLQQRFRALLSTSLYWSHRGFSDNPLLLSIMLLTFEMDADIPTLKYVFYQEAYVVLSKRHDANKDGYTRKLKTGWSSREFERYFTYFCANSYSNGDVSFSYTKMEDYFKKMDATYDLYTTNVDDFIYDATNNLCIMYQDGLKYAFIHRSFQEYFCAKFFHNQLDEELTNVIPIFDRFDITKKDDVALQMLYDMKPQAVEKYMFVPYLRCFIKDCISDKDIWTFLEKIYPSYEIADGTAIADDDYCLPHSNLYAFILEQYEVPLLSVLPEQLEGINWAKDATYVYREDTQDEVLVEDLPWDYEENYGEPEETGHIYCFNWGDIYSLPHMEKLKASIESESCPFVKEFQSIQELLHTLENSISERKSIQNIFNRLS